MTTIRTKIEKLKKKVEVRLKNQSHQEESRANTHDLSETKNINNTDNNDHNLRDSIINALQSIYDPEIPVNIYELGLIYNIHIDDENRVEIQMTLTSPNCPEAETLPQMVQDRVLTVTGVLSVKIDLVFEPPWSKECMSEATRLQLNML